MVKKELRKRFRAYKHNKKGRDTIDEFYNYNLKKFFCY